MFPSCVSFSVCSQDSNALSATFSVRCILSGTIETLLGFGAEVVLFTGLPPELLPSSLSLMALPAFIAIGSSVLFYFELVGVETTFKRRTRYQIDELVWQSKPRLAEPPPEWNPETARLSARLSSASCLSRP